MSEEKDAATQRLREAWAPPKGWRRFSAVNNDIIGPWYMTVAFSFMLFAGVLALIMRTQLAVPGNDLVSANVYNQLFTMHGSIMMFLFAVPIFEAVAVAILPEMLGCRDMPFPRLSAYGFWCFVIGGVFVCGSIFFNAAPKAGWFMYPPLSSKFEGIGADIWLLGLSFIEVSSIAAAVELIVGVLKCRPPGMRINLIPLYAWYVLAVAGMILFAFPPLIAGDLMLELERAFHWPFFDPEGGGDPILWQHLFWIFGHPEVYIIFLPSIALAAMIVPTFAGTPVVGYSWIVLSSVGTAFLSFGLWVHHMFATGLPAISLGFFSAASEAVAIPTGVQIFAFIATIWSAKKVRMMTPMLFLFGALMIFVLGGLTGIMVALAPVDWQVHDTYFIVAHLHYTLIGGMLFAVGAGLIYYLPKLSGKMLSERLGKWAFWFSFIGFNVTFFPMHLSGMMGMPRRVASYPTELGVGTFNLVSTIGAFILATGILIFLVNVIRTMTLKEYAPRNPWNAGTLEWASPIPNEHWSVRSIPTIDSRYPLWDDPELPGKMERGECYLADAREGRRETLVTSVLDARPEQCMRVSGPGYPPLVAAVFTGAAFILATFSVYSWAAVAGVLAVVAILYWLWTSTGLAPEAAEKDVGLGVRLPTYVSGPKSCGWWAMFITMLGDLTAFVSILFGYFFFWTIHEAFPPPGAAPLGIAWPLAGVVAAGIAWLSTRLAIGWTAERHWHHHRSALVLGMTASAVATGCLVFGPLQAGMDPTEHVYPATVWLILGWLAMHCALGFLMQGYCLARSFTSHFGEERNMEIWNVALYWSFTLVMTAGGTVVIVGFPALVGG